MSYTERYRQLTITVTAITNMSVSYKLYPETIFPGLAAYEDQSTRIRKARQDLYDFVILLLDTGARHSEISTLEWSQVNLQEKTVEIYRSKVDNRSILAMSNRVHQALMKRHAHKGEETYVFTGANGKPRAHRPKAFYSACRRAGIEGVSFHKLRHTLATKMVQRGLSLADIQAQLGHSTPAMTSRYAHLAPLISSQRVANMLDRDE